MLYVYAITDADHRVTERVGLADAPVSMLAEGDLAAAVSELGDAPNRIDATRLWTHEEVVESLMQGGAVLPMRFGTVLADADAVRRLLSDRQPELRSRLDRVRGAVELAIRAAIDQPPAPPRPQTGTEYLLARLETQRSTDAAVARIHGPLSRLARESAVRVGVRDEDGLRAAYLVDEELVDRFRARVEELEREETAESLTCTGPWPPYSFAGNRAGS